MKTPMYEPGSSAEGLAIIASIGARDAIIRESAELLARSITAMQVMAAHLSGNDRERAKRDLENRGLNLLDDDIRALLSKVSA